MSDANHTPDLVDHMQWISERSIQHTAAEKMRQIVNRLDDTEKLALFRDLTIERITTIIDKFPLDTQKQIVAIIANDYLKRWHQEQE